MRRILTGTVVVLALVVLLAVAFRGPLSLRLMRWGLDRNLGTDAIASLPDGLHVALCGAGGPLPDPKRSGPCVAVVAGRSLFVVDAGTGGARNLMRMRLQPDRIQALFLTHFHSDHIDGLGEMAMLRWANGGHHTPLPVRGPPGVEAVVAGFNHAYTQDAVYRVRHHGAGTLPPSGAGMEAQPFPTPTPGHALVVWEQDGVTVTAFRVDHFPVDPAVGYRFDYGGRSAVISGDTRRNAEVQRMAQGVDLLVHEALSPRLVEVIHQAAVAAGNRIAAKITADIPSYHTTPVEAAEIAQAAHVGQLLYYHITPPLILPGTQEVFLDGVADAYSGPVTVGVDGTVISLPRRTTPINRPVVDLPGETP